MNNLNTNININTINEELNNSIESPVVNNLQLIKLENVPTEVKDSITRVFENLDTTPTSFAKSFPNYGDKSKGIFGIVQNISTEINIIDSKYPNLSNEMTLSERNKILNIKEQNLRLSLRRWTITFFTLTGALAITYALFSLCNSSIFEGIKLNVLNPRNDSSFIEISTNINTSLFPLILFFKKFNNGKGPNFKKLLFYIISCTILIYYLVQIDSVLSFILTLKLRHLTIFFIIIISSVILYYLLSLILFILFSKNKVKLSKYLPSFLFNWLSLIEEYSKLEDKRWFIDLFVKNIFIYSIILLFLYIVL